MLCSHFIIHLDTNTYTRREQEREREGGRGGGVTNSSHKLKGVYDNQENNILGVSGHVGQDGDEGG